MASRNPPPASARGRLQLPLQLTPFINRRRELRALRALVVEHRLVSVVGPAGVGKTRLALEVAADVGRRFPAGAWFVELAATHEPRLLARVLAAAVGIEEDGRTDAVQQLVQVLEEQRAMFILDNCEHLVRDMAALADTLLRSCPLLVLMVTSREPLGVAGELVWRLDPMDTPQPARSYAPEELAALDSVALFLDRAWRARTGFAITAENAAAVAKLLRRLEGLPLAIELAAAWAASLSPADILASLDDRFRLLTARQRSTNPRHASLRAAIDASYEALDDAEKSLFRHLGMFVGGWSLDSMAAVCALDAPSALELLSRLVDRSLVTVVAAPSGHMRYRMLDAVREYAMEKVREAGELVRAREQFAGHFVQLAESVGGKLTSTGGRPLLELLDAEHDNCRAVLDVDPPPDTDVRLRLSAALTDYWRLRGHYTEARGRLKAALRGARGAATSQVRALHGLGMMAFLQADQAEAMRSTRRALALSRRIDDEHGQLVALEQLARVRFVSGDIRAARSFLNRGYEAARRLADPVVLCSYDLLLGQIALASGQRDEGLALLEGAIELAREGDNLELLALASVALGRVHIFERRPELARPVLMDALVTVRLFDGPKHVAPVLESLAGLAAIEGDDRRAAWLAGVAAALHDRAGARPPRAVPIRTALAALWQPAVSTPAGQKAHAEGRATQLAEAFRLILREDAGRPPAAVARRPAPGLTRRQLEIAGLIAQGVTNREIAGRLFISERTAEWHVEQIRNKLGFSSRAQIAAWMVRGEGRTEPGS